MKHLTMVNATPEQREKFEQLVNETHAAEIAFCIAYGKWGIFWDKMGYKGYRTPILDDKMARILTPSTTLIQSLMTAKDRAAEMGVLEERIAVLETDPSCVCERISHYETVGAPGLEEEHWYCDQCGADFVRDSSDSIEDK